MSKSKGNVLDPLDLIDGIGLDALVAKRTTGLMQPQMAPAIERATRKEFPDGIPGYGTDALRFTFAALATTGRDIRFDLGRIEGNRNFCNKLWNAARYVFMQTEGREISAPQSPGSTDHWIVSRMNRMVTEVESHFEGFRLDLAAQALYEFFWNEFCDWYLEFSKVALQNGSAQQQAETRHTLLTVLETSLRALHPIMPFITEEIWQRCRSSLDLAPESIMLAPFPSGGPVDNSAEQDVDWLKSVIQGVRRIRSELNVAPSVTLDLWLQEGDDSDRRRLERFGDVLSQLARTRPAIWLEADEDSAQCAVALVGDLRILIPLKGLVNVEQELGRLSKLLQREQADLARSKGKLGNERFVNNAPEAVVAQERERLAGHTAAIENLERQISQLQSLRD
jgi:valyl-tRNA synthetase